MIQHGGSRQPAMTTEAGTQICRVLIDCKAQLETVMADLTHLDHTDGIRQQLKAVYLELQAMHDRQIALRGEAQQGAIQGTEP